MESDQQPSGKTGLTQRVGLSQSQPCRTLKGRYSYELKHLLGAGGFAFVYRAICLNAPASDPDAPPATVAIKLFMAPKDMSLPAIMKRELSAMLALRHPHIPHIYDWLISDTEAFVVYEYFPRGSLGDAMAVMVRPEEAMGWRLMTHILEALQEAHKASLLHLDIKPKNILLDENDGFALSDFGLSQGHYAAMAYELRSVGTVGYQSPEQEQLDLDLVDARSDLFSLGATVWSFMTGLDLNRFADLLGQYDYQGAVCRLPRLRQNRPDVSSEMEQIVMRLLAVDRAERPGSAAETLACVQVGAAARDQAQGADGSQTGVSAGVTLRYRRVGGKEVRALLDGLVDPLWVNVCGNPVMSRYVTWFGDGEFLGREGDRAYDAFVLLKGSVAIERGGRQLAVEQREGTLLGEVAALTGRMRTADMRALGKVWVLAFNSAELERLAATNPGVAIRIMKSLAERVDRESHLTK